MNGEHFDQLGFVVRSMEEALRYWTNELGVGPFFLQAPYATMGIEHRGCVSPIDLTIALSYVDKMQIEVIEQTNEAQSPYREFLQSCPEGGLHHFARFVNDFANELEDHLQRGFELIGGRVSAAVPEQVRFAYLKKGSGHPLVELVEGRTLNDRNQEMRRIVESWDGRDPVRMPV